MIVCMGNSLLTYWLQGLACGGTMRQASGLEGPVGVQDGPPTTASVPTHRGGPARLGPWYPT